MSVFVPLPSASCHRKPRKSQENMRRSLNNSKVSVINNFKILITNVKINPTNITEWECRGNLNNFKISLKNNLINNQKLKLKIITASCHEEPHKTQENLRRSVNNYKISVLNNFKIQIVNKLIKTPTVVMWVSRGILNNRKISVINNPINILKLKQIIKTSKKRATNERCSASEMEIEKETNKRNKIVLSIACLVCLDAFSVKVEFPDSVGGDDFNEMSMGYGWKWTGVGRDCDEMQDIRGDSCPEMSGGVGDGGTRRGRTGRHKRRRTKWEMIGRFLTQGLESMEIDGRTDKDSHNLPRSAFGVWGLLTTGYVVLHPGQPP